MKLFLIMPVLFIFSGCSSSEKDKDRMISMMSTDLKNSQEMIDRDTQLTLKYLKDKTVNPVTAEKAKVIEEKVNAMIKVLNEPLALTKLQSLDDHSLVLLCEQIRTSSSELKKLYDKSSVYLDKEILSYSLLPDSFFFFKNKALSENKNLIEVAAIRICRLQNSIVHYYSSLINDERGMVSFDQMNILVSQNVKHLLPGEVLEISAGVGAVSSAALPRVVINGAEVMMEKGMATYKTMVNQPGRHTVRVNVRYLNQNGEQKEMVSDVEYFVDLPCPQANKARGNQE